MFSSDDAPMDASRVDRSAVFEVLPTPYVVLTPQLLVADMNAAYLEVTGRRRDELVGRYFLEAFPPPVESLGPDGRSELQVSLERVRDTGLPDTLPVQKYPIAGPDGVMAERHWLAVHVPVLEPDGAVRFIVQRTEDITEFSIERDRLAALADVADDGGWRARAERVEADLYVRARELADANAAKDVAARQVESLTEATLALAAASSLEEVERVVVGRGLPVLGVDGGGIVSPDGYGGWRITVNEALGEHVQQTYPAAPYDSMIPGCWCARTGERLLLPTRESGLAFDAEVMSAIYAATKRAGWAFAPLVVGERRLGSLAVSWVDEHELSSAELDLLDGFASQCAQALARIEIEQAQQAAVLEVQQLAHALQQALLTPPPQPDGLHVVTRYRPAGHQAQVGGDWYDAFLQPDGATMIVIGDVVGHDSVAAGKMGQLRGVLRTLAYDAERGSARHTPAAILTRLEQVTRGLDVDTLATAVVARIEQPSGRGSDNRGSEDRGSHDRGSGARVMHWTNAGHLAPMLLHADGTVDVLDSPPELLLGVDAAAARSDHTTELPADSTLVLFTDGLVERRDASLEVTVDALAAALADLAGRDVDELCDVLLARLAPDEGEDDIALIAVRVHADDTTRNAIGLPFTTDAPALARQFVHAHTEGFAASLRGDAELLVSELVTNAVRYGQPDVTLAVQTGPRGVVISVTDHGPDLPALPDGRPDPTAPSGRGLLIVDALADRWRTSRDAGAGSKSVAFELHAAIDQPRHVSG